MNLIKSNIIVNGLWIGKELSLIELLTINSFINNGHSFILWAYDDISTELPDRVLVKDASEIIPKGEIFKYRFSNQFGHGKGSYAGFSDIFRYKLLYEYGGWWTDMDVCCLKPLNFEEEYVFRTHHSLPLVGNIMKSPPKSPLMKACYKEASEKVTENNKDWHLPIQILSDNVYKFSLESYIKNFSNPDSWDVVRKFLLSKPVVSESWYVIHWVNEEWRRNRIHKDRFISNSLIYSLLKRHNLKCEKCEGLDKIKTIWKLSRFGFGFKYLNYYIKKIFG